MSKRIVVIGREFGSGGHEIGEQLSKALGIPLYDKELVWKAAESLGMDDREAVVQDERALSEFVVAYMARRNYEHLYSSPLQCEDTPDKMFFQQRKIIRNLANEGPCVIVGRCADEVLRERRDVLSVFIRADRKDRIDRVMRRCNLSAAEAEKLIQKTDRSRKHYYHQHTERDWGSAENYHLVLNASCLCEDEIVKLLCAVCEEQERC